MTTTVLLPKPAVLLRALLTFAVLAWSLAATGAPAALTLGGQERYPLASHLAVLEDPQAGLDVAAAASPERAGGYRAPGRPGELNFGYSSSAYWLRLELSRPPDAGADWLLEIAFPSLDDVQVFLPDGRGGFLRQVSGDRLPFAARPHADRNLVFPLKLAAGAPQALYVRVASAGSLTVPATLWSPEAFHAQAKRSYAALGLYFGLLVGLALYNLLLYVSLRDGVFLRYVAFVAAMALGQSAFTGLGSQFLWPGSPAWGDVALPIGMALTGLFGALFARNFLGTARSAPRLDRLFLGAVAAFAAAGVAALADYRTGAILTSLSGVAFAVLATASGLYFLLRGERSARYFLLAWTLLLAGVAMLAMRNLGWLPTTWLTVHAMQIGSGLEMLLLSLALADRVAATRQQKDQALAALVRAEQATVEGLRRSEQALEARIAERTAALDQANARYRAVVDNVKEVIFQTDAEGRWTFLNPAWSEVTGFAVDDSLGKPFLDYVHPEDRSRNLELFGPLVRREKACCRHEVRYLRRDGGFRWVEVFARLTLGAAGEATGTSGTLMDITERRALEEGLRWRERYERAALDNFPFLVWIKDGRSHFLAVNAPFAQACGRSSPDAVVGLSDLDVWPRDLAESYRADDRAVLQSGRAKSVEEEIDVDGQHRWFETYKAPVSFDGKLIGTVGFARDITERKRIESELAAHRHRLEELVAQRTAELAASEANLRLILESTADGLFGVDEHGRATFINPAACRLLGYAPDQVLGRPMHALIHHTRPDGTPFPFEECPVHATLRAGSEHHADKDVYWHADGHAVPVMYAARPILREGRPGGAVVSFMDIGALAAADQARERALQEAENLARVRQEFLANMSHEIRTPLNGVLGMAQIGLRESVGRTKSAAAFARILESGKLLLGIINDILDFSRIEAGKLGIDALPYDPGQVADQSADLLAERAREKGIALRIEKSAGLPRRCVGDPLRVQQVLANLLSNAVKFTDAGEVVLSAERDEGQLVLRVSDTGIGMSEEQIARIFNPFEQADGSMTRRYGGSGLGLTISRRLAELMHGEIRVSSRPGAGSRFELRLPLVEAEEAPPAPPVATVAGAGGRLAGLRLLVAEDSDINRVVLEELLTSEGAEVVLEEDGSRAVIEILRAGGSAYDLVLMDVQMPVMDGYEATRRIRELAPDLPVVGQTAHALAEDRNRCLAAGMVDHIAKPVEFEELVAVILRHVRRGPPGDGRPVSGR